MGPIIIAAVANKNVIGYGGKFPWGSFPPYLKRLKVLTFGRTVVMGYGTFLSSGNTPPGRSSLVLTRSPKKLARFGGVAGNAESVDNVIEIAKEKEVLIIGGDDVYQQFIVRPEVRVMYITRIYASFMGDAFFPSFSSNDWRMIKDEPHEINAESLFPFSFQTWIRK